VVGVVRETCDVLWSTLQPLYMPAPTQADWLKNAEGFQKRWQFPNCIDLAVETYKISCFLTHSINFSTSNAMLLAIGLG